MLELHKPHGLLSAYMVYKFGMHIFSRTVQMFFRNHQKE